MCGCRPVRKMLLSVQVLGQFKEKPGQLAYDIAINSGFDRKLVSDATGGYV